MPQAIDFYFEFSSPYGYFASMQIEDLGREIGRTVNWHPILLGPMFKSMGSAPLTEIPIKGDYARRDFARTAELAGIPFTLPTPFPIATVGAARAMLYVQRSDPAKAAQLARALYQAFFAHGRNIGDNDVVLQVAEETGLQRADVAAGMADESIKAQLKDGVAQAMAHGVFGSPFVIIDGEPFWGFDRFAHIRQWMAARRHTN
ncbi:2-hydroxychromene-2-carboxylate isomerase [Pusillimonas sp. TS35]|uniref:2-hydroxychromene-2-carboxylate isomerase n=1 Tax=Paracandidimonas lactea TaxID=2895524 RepID=UPI001367DDF1|nr:2-hydroxychromene-2-carboxylate isomerase [Paracandidimonas lactea]MYN11565.1 2-hydroxychromene-2-carboxylate isomerase [Pusillimonas sp. TS35]